MEFIQYIGAKTEGEGAKKKERAHIRMENKIYESIIISQAWESWTIHIFVGGLIVGYNINCRANIAC